MIMKYALLVAYCNHLTLKTPSIESIEI